MVAVTSVFVALLAVFGSLTQVAARSGTPVAGFATPVAAEECSVQPRTAAAIAEIVTAEDIAKATPFAEPAAYIRPEGAPADAETIARVTERVRQLAACVNA